MPSRSRLLLAAVTFLVLAAGAVVGFDGRLPPRRAAAAERFQQLVGGLGFGPAVDLSPCTFRFDPRLDASCELDTGPVPGGAFMCPRCGGSVLSFPHLPLEDAAGDTGDSDARVR